MIQFFDETGLNGLPAGVQVSVYPAVGAQTPASLVGAAFTQVGGYAAINVLPSTNYVAVFVGRNAPPTSQSFTSADVDVLTQVVCTPYRSPSLSLRGYTQEQANHLPTGPGWYSDAAKAPGGVVWAVLSAGAATVAQIDSQTQVALEMMRLQSCVGADIDSWQADYLNGYLPRYLNESDAQYIARIMAFLAAQKTTLFGMQTIVDAFFAATAGDLGAAYAQNITFDGQGGYDAQGGYDTGQGYEPAVPTVLVWDRQSRPDLADQFNINPGNDNADFVIMIGYNPPDSDAWFLDHSHLDYDTYLVDANSYDVSDTAPDPRLAAMVGLVKAAGTHPIYITYLSGV